MKPRALPFVHPAFLAAGRQDHSLLVHDCAHVAAAARDVEALADDRPLD